MKHALLPAALATLLAAPAFAEDKATVATCGATGCTCRLAALTPSEIEAATGIPAPEGAEDMILVSYDGAYIWSRLTGDEVDTLMGGDGTCELELFDEIVPRDGTWAPAIIARQDSGCPEGLGALLDPMLPDAAGNPRAVRWGGRFDPEKMSIGPSTMRWTRTGPRAFTGAADGVDMPSVKIAVTVDTRLESEDLAKGTLRVTVRTDAADAAGQAILRAAGLADCDVAVDFDFARSGD